MTEPARAGVVHKTKDEAGWAVHQSEQDKIRKWEDVAKDTGQRAEIVPLAFEATGRRGAQVDTWLRRMSKIAPSFSAPSLETLFVQLSVTMAKFNVVMAREAVNKATRVGLAAV